MFRFTSLIVTLGVALAPVAASAHVGPEPLPARRGLWQIQHDLGDKLDVLENLNQQILDLASRRPSARRFAYIKQLSWQSAQVMRELRALQTDLREALRFAGQGQDDQLEEGDWEGAGRPRPNWDPSWNDRPVTWLPRAMDPGEFARVLAAIDQATFAEPQMNAIRDFIQAGSFFDIAQAQTIMARFPHESNKVEVGALLCPAIVERGALPQLLSGFTFESYRQELRERTGGQCGWQR